MTIDNTQRKLGDLIHTVMGSATYRIGEREENDYYATDPKAVEMLLELEEFSKDIWENACGGLHLANVLEKKGYNVKKSDIINRGGHEVIDFLGYKGDWKGDIITNPPYKLANEWINKSMEVLNQNSKLALFLPVRYLEGKTRKKLFDKYPPKTIWVSSSRILCVKNGDFDTYKSSAMAFSWWIWEKGHNGETKIKWFN